MFEIVEIIRELLSRCFYFGTMVRMIIMVKLRPAGEPGLNQVPYAIVRNFFLIRFYEHRKFRPRPHERHVTLKHIPRLRKFIESANTKKLSKRCYHVLALKHLVSLVSPAHTAELQHHKWLVILSHAYLAVKHGPPILQFYYECEYRITHEWNETQKEPDHNIHKPFHCVVKQMRVA